jgi:hypothetical protein
MAGIMQKTLRDGVLTDVLDSLDSTEAIHRQLGKTIDPTVRYGMNPEDFARLAQKVEAAYENLCVARQILDGAA